MAKTAKTKKAGRRFPFSFVEEEASLLVDRAVDIRRGYSWEKAQGVKSRYHLTDPLFAKIIRMSDRTLTRARQRRAALDPVASDRLYRTERLLDLATLVFEDGARAMAWLGRSQPGLGGRVPMELLDTDPGAKAVETLLGQIEFGVLP